MTRPDEARQVSELLAQRYYRDMHTPARRGRLWSLVDLGELAVRLGSPVAYDRHGNVIWYDDFENGLHKWWWAAGTAGSGSGPVLCRHVSQSGGCSARLVCAGTQSGETQSIQHRTALPMITPWPRLGGELAFAYDDGLAWLSLMISVYPGGGITPYSRYGLRYKPSQALLEILSPGGAWEVLANGVWANLYPHFNNVKLVVDPAGRYTKALFNEHELQLDQRLPETGLSSGSSSWTITISAANLETQTGSLWVDDVILTVNE